MCGIVCYIGDGNTKDILMEGLKRLEYRGYDSAGIAIKTKDVVECYKSVGKLRNLDSKLFNVEMKGSLGIAHTRWATHGKPTEENAHPHTDGEEKVFVVHNGILENYEYLKEKLKKKGVEFRSETDTEILAHLISMNFDGNLTLAVKSALEEIEGAFGIAVMHADVPDTIVIARRSSPIMIGLASDGIIAASDASAMMRYTDRMIQLEDDEIATLTKDDYSIINFKAQPVSREVSVVKHDLTEAELGNFPHFMLKEIYEQPRTVKTALRGRLDFENGMPMLGGIQQIWDHLKEVKNIIIVSCGTSYYAGCIGKYVFEELTDVDVKVEVASEFRYSAHTLKPNTFIIAISQSGETADTYAAIKEVQRKGVKALGIVNVVGSTISKETDAGIYIRAGLEIGVASTKCFVSQLVILTLLALYIGRHRALSIAEGLHIMDELKTLPDKIQDILDNAPHIESVAKKYYSHNNWLFLARKYNYPIAMEGALKLKEISYIHAEGYAAGEMKHGPIALIDENTPSLFVAPKDEVYYKVISNINEVKSRGGKTIVITTQGDLKIKDLADDVIYIPETLDLLYPILTVIPCQLMAYYCASFLGRDIDQPRNLAKSVTVE